MRFSPPSPSLKKYLGRAEKNKNIYVKETAEKYKKMKQEV